MIFDKNLAVSIPISKNMDIFCKKKAPERAGELGSNLVLSGAKIDN